MTRAFDLALHRVKHMSRPRPPKLPNITIGIDFNQSPISMAGGGGLYPLIKRQGGAGIGSGPGPGSGIGEGGPDHDAGYATFSAPTPPMPIKLPPKPPIKLPSKPKSSVPSAMEIYMANYLRQQEEEDKKKATASAQKGGGISSIQKRMNIGGEPHRLSYINSDEASLLKQLGGSGQPVRGIPAYYMGDDTGEDPGIGSGWSDDPDPGDQSGVDDTSISDVDPEAADIASQEDLDEAAIGTLAENLANPAAAAAAMASLNAAIAKDNEAMQVAKDKEEEKKSQIPAIINKVLSFFVPTPVKAIRSFLKARETAISKLDNFDKIIENPSWFTPEAVAKAKEDKDALEQDLLGIGSKAGMKEYDELMTGETTQYEQGLTSILPDPDEDEDEEEKFGMDKYFEVMRGKTPLGYTENEKRILARIYPPDHPIWKDINRERDPMWPIIDPDPDPDPPVFPFPGPPRIDPPKIIPFDPDEPRRFYPMTDEDEDDEFVGMN